ncbi:MAG: FAD-dependent oxidoreductase [Planctomycetota bacterium]|nr:FAD-dependent oxidoreductase [Planctomycetota bacterium]
MNMGPAFALEDDLFLLPLVRPAGWSNPHPKPFYDLVVLGGGAAGLISAFGAVGMGARVALVERDRLGGDCLNTGCVPSKALAAFARHASGTNAVERLEDARGAFRKARARLAPNDSADRLSRSGVDLFFGEGAFASAASAQVEGLLLRFRTAALCVGASPVIPAIPGLADCQPWTTASFFDLNRLPSSIIILGGGPVGCELAQSLSRLGCKVHLIERDQALLGREDAEAAQQVTQALIKDRVELCTGTRVLRAELTGAGVTLHLHSPNGPGLLTAEGVLSATGRKPNLGNLSLDLASIQTAGDLPVVDCHLQTSNPRVFVAGDATGPPYLTHRSGAHAAVLLQNALFPHPLGLGKARADRLLIPRCLHTDPAIAQVGLTAEEALSAAIPHEILTVPAIHVDRLELENEPGFLRLVLSPGSDRLLGATVVGKQAGELLFPALDLMRSGRGLRSLLGLVLPYPARMEIWTRAAQIWRGNRFGKSPITRRWVRWLARRGP